MGFFTKWKYNYEDRCECSEDDRCGCTYPENMERSYSAETSHKVRLHHEHNHAMVGKTAPNFIAPAVFANNLSTDEFNFFDYINGNYALLMFYLADFSAVCPKEIIAFNQAADEFIKRGLKVVAVSVDSLSAHIAWKKQPFAKGGIGNVCFPLVSDLNKKISSDYGILRTDGMSQRASFLIDKEYTIRYQVIYDKKIERNVNETLRVVDKVIELDKSESSGLEGLIHKEFSKNKDMPHDFAQ